MIGLLILVFVETQDVSTMWSGALSEAVQETLGASCELSIRPIAPEASSEDLVAEGREAKAFAVARISWRGPAREDARLTLTVVATGRTSAQPLSFRGSDPLVERGRALGLVLAALLEAALGEQATPAPKPAPPVGIPAPPSPPSAPLPAGRRWALDAVAEGGIAIGGAGSGGGGALGFRWWLSPRVGVRLGARARFGQVGAAQATSLALAAAAGLSADLVNPEDGQGLGLGVRADALLLYESLSHLSSDDPAPDRRGRLLPGAALLGEVRWSLSPAVAILVAAGPEIAFGTTEVFVRQAEVARLTPLRAVLQGGLWAAF